MHIINQKQNPSKWLNNFVTYVWNMKSEFDSMILIGLTGTGIR